ncbi:hypothetical protein Trydic_g17711 [Trypoxylus dichotomus]
MFSLDVFTYGIVVSFPVLCSKPNDNILQELLANGLVSLKKFAGRFNTLPFVAFRLADIKDHIAELPKGHS